MCLINAFAEKLWKKLPTSLLSNLQINKIMKNGFKSKIAFLKCLFLISMIATDAGAEGSKQFLPNSSSYGSIQVNDVGRPFALTTNTDPLHRLYFHIASTTERVYFGFSRHSTSVASSGQYQIKNPSGTIVQGPLYDPKGLKVRT